MKTTVRIKPTFFSNHKQIFLKRQLFSFQKILIYQFSLLPTDASPTKASKVSYSVPTVSPENKAKDNNVEQGSSNKSKGKFSELLLKMKSPEFAKNHKISRQAQEPPKAIHIKTSVPVKQDDDTYKLALFIYGYTRRQSRYGSHEIFGIKADIISRAFQLADLNNSLKGFEGRLGSHKYLDQLLGCTNITPLKVQNNDMNQQDIIQNGNYPQCLLYGIIKIEPVENEIALGQEIKSIATCFEDVFKHTNFFEFYHQAMYWTQLGRDASIHDVLTSLATFEDELGTDQVARAVDQELKKNSFYKYLCMSSTKHSGPPRYGKGFNPPLFNPTGSGNDSIFSIPYKLESDVPLMKLVKKEVVREIGYSLYGIYTPSMKTVLFGYPKSPDNDNKNSPDTCDDSYFRS